MRSDQLVNLLVQAVEAKSPGAVYDRLSPGTAGFRAQFPDGSLCTVTIKEIQPAQPEEDSHGHP